MTVTRAVKIYLQNIFENSKAALDFETLISTSQYIDISKLDDFVNDEQ